ncbi:MAG: UDP-N-acetylglucosamine 2-epimerase (hydrolyzing) [Candidatus Omnitrophica bacterium]|nr:UDP-N-acetylglucosamine 2-epimerase (hydrolyzing) [Candidatus Omnitrophota bacterium]
MKRKIFVVTGSRAEYGLLRPFLEKIKNDGDLKLQLAVTGAHLKKEFGFTYKEIEKDSFCIDRKVDINLISDTAVGISGSMAMAISGFAAAYEEMKPDVVVVLGDRFEIFGAVAAAHVACIPVAHIHGGELTEGVIDDAFRHSITKMSQLHFTATEEYRRRVIQLGESPECVFNVGAPGLDGLKDMPFLTRDQLKKKLRINFDRRNLLITFHPATLEDGSAGWQFKNLLSALDGLNSTHLIFTKANADSGGKIVNRMIDEYVSMRPDRAEAFTSMGRLNYLSAMRIVDAVVGNSSSGIMEAPSFRVGTINIGSRQRGRIKSRSVIDCRPLRSDIVRALKELYSAKFQNSLRNVKNSYEGRNASLKIWTILKKHKFEKWTKKSFYDIPLRISGK